LSNPLLRKLESFVKLHDGDVDLLNRLVARTREHRTGTDLIREGDRPDDVFLLVEGWAYRYKILPDGSRQIIAYLIPGDLCDIHIFILKEMDHALGLLSDARVASISRAEMQQILDEHPAIAQALFWSTLVDEAVLREWLVNMGQRDAYSRIAHLFCEMWLRMQQVDLASGNEFFLPLTQEQLGDTIGLTKVHVNRVIQRMRGEGLISLTDRTLTIHDAQRLREIAEFDPNYLHIYRRS
jgi:CRP-like cAMP-binding protein